jgi:hypothetical protein
MATIGITTAMAILAPDARPLDELEPDPEALKAEGVALDEEDVDV